MNHDKKTNMDAIMRRLADAKLDADCARLRRATDNANRVNQRVSNFLDGADGKSELVRRSILPERAMGQPPATHGIRRTFDRLRAELRSAESDCDEVKHSLRATGENYQHDQRSHGFSDSDIQRPGPK